MNPEFHLVDTGALVGPCSTAMTPPTISSARGGLPGSEDSSPPVPSSPRPCIFATHRRRYRGIGRFPPERTDGNRGRFHPRPYRRSGPPDDPLPRHSDGLRRRHARAPCRTAAHPRHPHPRRARVLAPLVRHILRAKANPPWTLLGAIEILHIGASHLPRQRRIHPIAQGNALGMHGMKKIPSPNGAAPRWCGTWVSSRCG